MSSDLAKSRGVSWVSTRNRWQASHPIGGTKRFETFEEAVAQRKTWEAEFGVVSRGSKPGEKRGAAKDIEAARRGNAGKGSVLKPGAGVKPYQTARQGTKWIATFKAGPTRKAKTFKTEEEARNQRARWEAEYLDSLKKLRNEV